MNIVDRRRNPGGKSLSNRQRFLRRARAAVREAVRDASRGRTIREVEKSGEIVIPAGDVSEPSFRREASGGQRDYVLPGNADYVQGDEIERPEEGGGSGAGGDGEGEDEFRFVLTANEFLDLFLEDLELPDLAKRKLLGEGAPLWKRAGYRTDGPPNSMSVPRTLKNSMARRIALKRPSLADVAALTAQIEAAEAAGEPRDEISALRDRAAQMKRRAMVIPYIDPIDVRYRRYEAHPTPVAQAVVFCLMDVSGSMDEHRKDLAKRFFTLLYLFLTRRYERVEIVFIRHTHEASEVDEETFFYSRETGGTVVSTALEEMIRIARDRYPAAQWNIYGAQASDGDNTAADNPKAQALLTEEILPMVQYYAYLEVDSEEANSRVSTLWRAYDMILPADGVMAMRKANHRRDIYPVFRELFSSTQDASA